MSDDCVIETHDRLTPALHADWMQLLERAGWVTPFEHPDWVMTAIAMSVGESCPFLLTARQAETQMLRGVLALGLTWERIGPWQLATIRSLSLHRHDLTTAVAEPEWRDRVEQGFARELTLFHARRHQVRVRGIPASASLLDRLGESWHQELPSPLRVAELGGKSSWREVIHDGHQRRELERVGRKLSREHGYTTDWAASAGEASDFFRQFIAMHSRQLAERGRANSFESAGVVEALERRFAEWVPQGLADVGLLRVGELPIAGYLLMHVPRATWAYRTTFVSEWGRYAPGALMLTAAIDRAIGRGSLRYDFGWGDQPYKRAWSVVIDQTIQLSAQTRLRRLPFRLLPRLGVTSRQICADRRKSEK